MREPPPPPSLPAKELPINLHKFIWRVLMISSLVLGAYMFIGVKKRDPGTSKRKSETVLQQPVQLLRHGIRDNAAA